MARTSAHFQLGNPALETSRMTRNAEGAAKSIAASARPPDLQKRRFSSPCQATSREIPALMRPSWWQSPARGIDLALLTDAHGPTGRRSYGH